MNDPNTLPPLASVVFIRIADYTRRQVAEQSRLRSQLEAAVAVALIDIPVNCRIMMDAPDGTAIAVLRNPVAALDIAERTAGVSATGISVAIGINHGAIQLTRDDADHPGLAGDAIGVAASIADFVGPDRVTATRSFADALLQVNPDRARSLRKVGTYTDRQLRTHELLTPKANVPARRRTITSVICGLLMIILIGSAVAIRVPQNASGTAENSIWKTFGGRASALLQHYRSDDGR